MERFGFVLNLKRLFNMPLQKLYKEVENQSTIHNIHNYDESLSQF